MLTPVDLETTVFRRGFRGYQVREVQDFMARLTLDYGRLYRENIEFKEKLEALESRLAAYQKTEDTLQNTLLLAERTAEEVKQAGQKQAELILREAEHRAEQVRIRVKEEIRTELENLARLKELAEFFRMQFKHFLASLSSLADSQLSLDAPWEELFKKAGAAVAVREPDPPAETLGRSEGT